MSLNSRRQLPLSALLLASVSHLGCEQVTDVDSACATERWSPASADEPSPLGPSGTEIIVQYGEEFDLDVDFQWLDEPLLLTNAPSSLPARPIEFGEQHVGGRVALALRYEGASFEYTKRGEAPAQTVFACDATSVRTNYLGRAHLDEAGLGLAYEWDDYPFIAEADDSGEAWTASARHLGRGDTAELGLVAADGVHLVPSLRVYVDEAGPWIVLTCDASRESAETATYRLGSSRPQP